MSFKVLSSVKSDKEVVKFYAVFRKPILTPSIEQRSIFATTESEIAAIKRWIYCKLLHLHIFIVAFSSNKHYRLKNCRIFIRNFEACVINASHFHNSADRLRFDLPTTEFTMNLNRNNQAVLATDLGDVLLDLSVVLRYSIVYEAFNYESFRINNFKENMSNNLGDYRTSSSKIRTTKLALRNTSDSKQTSKTYLMLHDILPRCF